jgi:hypothetical protein
MVGKRDYDRAIADLNEALREEEKLVEEVVEGKAPGFTQSKADSVPASLILTTPAQYHCRL